MNIQLTVKEAAVLRTILSDDILRQTEQLERLRVDAGDQPTAEQSLETTKDLHRRVVLLLDEFYEYVQE